MRNFRILPLMATVFLAGALFFVGCEKESLVNTGIINIVKCFGVDDLDDDIYYSTPENPNILIRLRDTTIVSVMGIRFEEACGHAFWQGNTFHCRGEGDDCGNCFELDEHGAIVNSGTYTHVRGPENEITVTYYNWNDCHEE